MSGNIVVLPVQGQDTHILGVEMVQDLSNRDIEVAEELGLQAADEHGVDRADKQLFDCFVGGHILFETLSGRLE